MPRILLAAGAALLLAAVSIAFLTHRGQPKSAEVTVSVPTRTTSTTATTTTTPPAATTTTTPPPAAAAFSWQGAGAIVWHSSFVDPEQFGTTLRDAGFDWVAVYLGGPGDPATPDPGWIYRVQLTSGLPVGGWSVLGDDPSADSATVVTDVKQFGLAFYIADAEAPYGYTDQTGTSSVRYARSKQFVTAFRAAEPKLPAAVSSYCRPDEHDLDWHAWANAGFAFLPQAYTNDFGALASPAACVSGAARWFPRAQIHPTVASYSGTHGVVSAAAFASDLEQAHTTGFSIFPAEAGLTPADWQAYGAAIKSTAIAKAP